MKKENSPEQARRQRPSHRGRPDTNIGRSRIVNESGDQAQDRERSDH
jgi:hypothetical protein